MTMHNKVCRDNMKIEKSKYNVEEKKQNFHIPKTCLCEQCLNQTKKVAGSFTKRSQESISTRKH